MHGTSDRYRCDTKGCPFGPPLGSIPAKDVDLSAFLAHPTTGRLPRCPFCKGFLRMHVLWFDECYTEHSDYQFNTVLRAAQHDARVVVFAGTSFAVGITDQVLKGALHRVPLFNTDPTPRIKRPRVRSITMPAEVALLQLCQELGIEVPGPDDSPLKVMPKS